MLLSMNTVQRSPRLAGCFPRESGGTDILKFYAQFLGLLLNKGTGTGRTYFVHLKIADNPAFKSDELGILPANLEHGVHGGINGHGGPGLGCDFIANHIRPDHTAGHVPAGTSGCDSGNPDPLAEFLVKFRKAGAYGLCRISRGTQVTVAENSVLFVHEDKVGAGRTDIDAQPAIQSPRVRQRMRSVLVSGVPFAKSLQWFEMQLLMQVDMMRGTVD